MTNLLCVCVGLIDYSLKTRSHPCLSFKNITVYCCCGHHKVFVNVGRNWREFSTVSAYQPCNKGSLWVCRRRRHELSVQQPGLVFEEPQAGLMSSSLNSAPPSLGMETGAKTVVPATDMWGAWRGKKKAPFRDKGLSAMFLPSSWNPTSSSHMWRESHLVLFELLLYPFSLLSLFPSLKESFSRDN